MTSKEQVLERYPSAEYMAGAIVSHYAVASEAFVYFREEDAAWESAARLLPAPKEGEKVCIGATDDGFEYAKVPSKDESGDVLSTKNRPERQSDGYHADYYYALFESLEQELGDTKRALEMALSRNIPEFPIGKSIPKRVEAVIELARKERAALSDQHNEPENLKVQLEVLKQKHKEELEEITRKYRNLQDFCAGLSVKPNKATT